MTHQELVEIAYKWVMRLSPPHGFGFKEFHTYNKEIPDVIAFNAWYSTLIECKVSRSDFLQDKKKPHRAKGMGTYRFFMCPNDLIQVHELPDNWGLLWVSPKGRVKVVHNPYNPKGGNIWDNGFERDLEAENRMMYCALRRMELRGYLPEIYDGPLKK